MAGITNRAFRTVCTLWGAQFSFTEMISAESVIRNLKAVQKMLPRSESNVAVQLFGSEPKTLAQAAKIVEPYAAWIDINAACPVKKVIKKNSGGALLKDLDRLSKIVESVKSAVDKPVTVKIRIGFEDNDLDRIMERCIESGADGIEVHGRTVAQQYSHRATWDLKLSQYCIPTAVSGDIYEVSDVYKAIEISGARAVLVARGALRKPWIFSQIVQSRTPTIEEVKGMFMEHLKMQIEDEGEKSVYKMRQFIAGYTHGMRGAREFREKFMKIDSLDTMKNCVEEFFNSFLMNECKTNVVEWIEDSQSRRCCT
ncbi:MAG TPA: tRNA-dihydrouridine synthase [Pseudothermotoga sp.]|nr:tRNA-dihydrouridine synthase [Pseudothermotoga sp.]